METDYPLIVEPIPPADGGGWLATVPDLPGCMSDGDTPEDAVRNARDAILDWIDAAQRLGRGTKRRVASGSAGSSFEKHS